MTTIGSIYGKTDINEGTNGQYKLLQKILTTLYKHVTEHALYISRYMLIILAMLPLLFAAFCVIPTANQLFPQLKFLNSTVTNSLKLLCYKHIQVCSKRKQTKYFKTKTDRRRKLIHYRLGFLLIVLPPSISRRF